jgi:hypothetical protein
VRVRRTQAKYLNNPCKQVKPFPSVRGFPRDACGASAVVRNPEDGPRRGGTPTAQDRRPTEARQAERRGAYAGRAVERPRPAVGRGVLGNPRDRDRQELEPLRDLTDFQAARQDLAHRATPRVGRGRRPACDAGTPPTAILRRGRPRGGPAQGALALAATVRSASAGTISSR